MENIDKDILLSIVNSNIESQEELLSILNNKGYDINQSNISRKLKKLGVSKKNKSYILQDFQDIPSCELVICLPNLIIVRTIPGFANAIAAKVENLHNLLFPEISGTIAGDDTIFFAVDSQKIENLANKLTNILGVKK